MSSRVIEMTEQTFNILLDKTSTCAYIVDYETSNILMLNEAAALKANRSKTSLIGTHCNMIFPGNYQACANCPVKNKQLSENTAGTIKQFRTNRYFFDNRNRIELYPIKWHDGNNAILVIHEKSGQVIPVELCREQMLFRDYKYALPNAYCLEKDIVKIYPDIAFTLICFDIVSLRSINDAYGRKVGDLLLFAIRDWIISLSFGQLYRLDSDEFGILITAADMETVQEMARRIYRRFDKAWDIILCGDIRHVFCAVSIGVISSETLHFPNDILNVIGRILKIASRQADIAVYDKATDQILRHRLDIEISLKNCVKNGLQGFDIHYQPIINAISGLWCGLEALCRWTSPALGPVPPQEFISIAEQQGLIGAIGEWVLETSVKQCMAWHLDEHEEFFLDVNLSPVQLMDKNLDSKILGILKRCGYPSHKLSLEITESTQINFNNHTLDAIFKLTQQNIPVALDDFGTGYSSFNSLIHLPVSILKTEKAFLNNIEHDDYLQKLLETMVGLAHVSGMKITAEGVETAGQMKILMDNRVDYVQGYLFSKPVPSDRLEKKLNNFYFKEEDSIAGEYGRIDLNSLLNSDNAYSLTPSFYKTLIRCMQILYDTPDINDGINAVLAVVGEKLGVSRHVLFLKDPGGDTFTNTHEWCDENIPRKLGHFNRINIKTVTPSFIPLFKKEGMIVSPDVSALPEDISRMFQDNGIKSNIAVPLWRGEELLGYMGLDVCSQRRNWQPEEALMVHSIGRILASVFDKMCLRSELAHLKKEHHI